MKSNPYIAWTLAGKRMRRLEKICERAYARMIKVDINDYKAYSKVADFYYYFAGLSNKASNEAQKAYKRFLLSKNIELPWTLEKCKNYKRYKGIMKPRCGCQACKKKYAELHPEKVENK